MKNKREACRPLHQLYSYFRSAAFFPTAKAKSCDFEHGFTWT